MNLVTCKPYFLAQQPYTDTANGLEFDPYFDYNTLLVSMDGASDALAFTDVMGSVVTTSGGVIATSAPIKFDGTRTVGYFNGTGAKLVVNASSNFLFSTDYTIEGWFYATNPTAATQDLIGNYDGNTGDCWAVGLFSTTGKLQYCASGGTVNVTSASAVTQNVWHHFAAVRRGNTCTLYLDGVSQGAMIFSGTLGNQSKAIGIGSRYYGGNYFNGYLADFRITNGAARYTKDFTPPTRAFQRNSFSVTFVDPHFRNVAALIYGSGNEINGKPVTTAGTVTQSATNPKFFGASSMDFRSHGSLQLPSGEDFKFGTGDFTLEAWVQLTAYDPIGSIISVGNQAGDTGAIFYVNASGYLVLSTAWTGLCSSNPVVVPLNTWTHVAATRSGSTITLWINGVQVGTVVSAFNCTDGVCYFGAHGPYYFTGFLGEARITKGIARYTSAFKPARFLFPKAKIDGNAVYDPYAAFVKLQMHMEGVDGGTTFTEDRGQIITNANAVATSNLQVKYGLTSAKFNGIQSAAGSYLTVPYSSDYAFGSGDFTIESWVYPTGYPTSDRNAIMANWYAGQSGNCAFVVGLLPNGILSLVVNNSITANSSTAVPLNTWSHIAISRVGAWVYMFIGGIIVYAGNFGAGYSFYAGAKAIGIGGHQDQSWSFKGHIDELRVTKGVGRYVTSFVPPAQASPNLAAVEYQARYVSDPFLNSVMCHIGFDNAIVTDSTGRLVVTSTVLPTTREVQEGGAGIFTGSTTSLKLAPGTDFAPGLGDFTLELWVKTTVAQVWGTDATTHSCALWSQSAAGSNYFLLELTSDGNSITPQFLSTATSVEGPSVPSGAWTHIALVRSLGLCTIYVDGIPGTSVPNTVDFSDTTLVPTIGQLSHTTTKLMFAGLMDNIKYTKAARYNTAFDPIMLSCNDPHASSTKLLIHADGAEGSTSLTDVRGKSVTTSNVTLTSTGAKFAQTAMFNGTSSYAVVSASADFAFSSDFTIECWVRADDIVGNLDVIGNYVANTSSDWVLVLSQSRLQWYPSSAASAVVSDILVVGRWYHIALVRRAGFCSFYMDGKPVGTPLPFTGVLGDATKVLNIGSRASASGFWHGAIEEIRITNGVARYVMPFTPSVMPFPNS